jgi:hypothetical protein
VAIQIEPDADYRLDLIAQHRPEQFKLFLETVPADWWVTAVRTGRNYSVLKQSAAAFEEHYHALCASLRFSHDWFSNKIWLWHDILAPIRKTRANILEVGVFEGRSVVFCLEFLPRSTIVAIAHFVCKKGWTSSQGITLEADCEEIFDGNVARYGNRVRKMTSSSWAGLSALIYERATFDLIYVDAAHNTPDVLADSLLAWRMLKVGGLMIWDDFMLDVWSMSPNSVTQGICTFLKMYAGQYEWLHAGWQVAVRKTGDQTGSYIGV